VAISRISIRRLQKVGRWLKQEINIKNKLEMNQTQNQSKYYYSPRFRHFNIYRRDPDGDTKVDDAATQEEAKRKVYELNGWNYKPKNNTVK
jgi:conserved domain protein